MPDVNVKKAASSADRFDANAGLADKSTDAALLSMHMLFAFYDTDASGSIDAKELLKMMTNVLKKAKDSGGADKKKKGPSGPWSKWEDDMLNNALAAANGEDSDMPTLRDVHEMMCKCTTTIMPLRCLFNVILSLTSFNLLHARLASLRFFTFATKT